MVYDSHLSQKTEVELMIMRKDECEHLLFCDYHFEPGFGGGKGVEDTTQERNAVHL